MTKKFVYKIYDKERMLAIADSIIVDKTLSGKNLEIKVTKEFYHDKECDDKTALTLIKDARIVNAIGNDIISLMVKKNIIQKENVLYLGEVAHAQIFTV